MSEELDASGLTTCQRSEPTKNDLGYETIEIEILSKEETNEFLQHETDVPYNLRSHAQENAVQEVQNHICNFLKNDQTTAEKLYALYKKETTNPVDLATYQRIFGKLIEKMKTAQLVLEEVLDLETSNEDIFEDPTEFAVAVSNGTEEVVDFQVTNIENHFSQQFMKIEMDLGQNTFESCDYGEKETSISRKRSKKPETWKQNIRKQLYQKGQSFVDRFGIEHAGKVVGPPCEPTCYFACAENFSYEQRQCIHSIFWNLTTLEKRNFIAAHVERTSIQKRNKKCERQVAPRKKQSFRYFLPIADDDLKRVCKFFFLKTLAISEKKIHYYFENYHNNEAARRLIVLPGRGRKGFLQSRLQAARDHINSFSDKNEQHSVAKMYVMYKAETENPIGIDTYRRLHKTQMITVEAAAVSDRETSSRSGSLENYVKRIESSKTSYYATPVDTKAVEKVDLVFSGEQFSDMDDSMEGKKNTKSDYYSTDMLPQASTELKDFEEPTIRRRNPDMWKQNVRIQRRQKGLPYVDRKGVERSGKSVGESCGLNCTYLCTKNFSNDDRLRIHSNFWSSTQTEKHDFYETYIEKVQIKKSSKQNPKRKRGFHYFLPHASLGKPIRVCQFYFLKTLCISDAKIHYYFAKEHNEDDDVSRVKGRRNRAGRKAFSKSRMQEVRDHISSLITLQHPLSAAKMYELYKLKSENPVCIDLYRRVKQEILAKFQEATGKDANQF